MNNAGEPRTRKGDRSRAAIVESAAVRFERDGFERTTIRAVADDAGIDAAMVMRYFGNKEGLFEAVTTIDLELTRFAAVPADELGYALAEHAVSLWGSETPGRALRILLTAAPTDPRAGERIREVFLAQVVPHLEGERHDASVCAGFIASTILGYAYARYLIRIPSLTELTDAQAADGLGRSLQSHLR
jgi:AcrR family transcriptional regulator